MSIDKNEHTQRNKEMVEKLKTDPERRVGTWERFMPKRKKTVEHSVSGGRDTKPSVSRSKAVPINRAQVKRDELARRRKRREERRRQQGR